MKYKIDGLRERRSISFFSDIVPEKNIIEDILLDSVKYTPNKCSVPYHKVKVYGPEYKEDKEKLVIQTNCNPAFEKIPDGKSKINLLKSNYEEWFDMHINQDINAKTIKNRFDSYNFNPQVLAPYLLVFYDTHETRIARSQPHISMGENKTKIRALQSSSIHAYNIACFAAERKVSSSFLANISVITNYNPNKIDINEDMVLILGLGYPEKTKWNPKYREHFDVNRIVEWQNEIQN